MTKAAGARSKPGTHKRAGAPSQGRAESIYRVESAEPYGWIVYLDGHSETHFFRSRPLALAQACEWAEANRPSLVLLSNIAGHIERHKEYLPAPDPAAAA